MNSLSVDLRPSKISEVIGLEYITEALQKQINAGTVARAYMFSGPPGVGKTSLALILARMVQGPDYPEDAPLDLREVNAAENNGVDFVKSLVAECAYRPFTGKYRVVILNESQQLTSQAQEVLQPPLESPESDTVWILTTKNPSKIDQAIQDRCAHYKLRGMAEVQVTELIQRASDHLKVPYKDEFVVRAVNANIQSPRVLLQSYEKYVSGVPLNDCFAAAAHEPFYKEIALSVVRGNWETCRQLLAEVQTADSRALRTIVAGMLRSALIKEPLGVKADAIATCLVGMNAANGFEDGLSWSSTVGLFYKAAKAIGAAK